MRALIATLFCALLLLPCCAAARAVQVVEGARVLRVVDGDTLEAASGGERLRVRLYGIDAPEVAHRGSPGQPHGSEAAAALARLALGRGVRLEVTGRDRYRRAIAVVVADGIEVNRELVRLGWAWAYRAYLDRPHASQYLPLEEQARRERRGLWADPNPVPPWEFRHRRR